MNEIKINNYEKLNEKVYSKVLDNGLKVIVIPKKGFGKYFASFTTEFGGNDTGYIDPITNEAHLFPSGVAHFLEHKMFSMPTEDGRIEDVTLQFSNLGIDANAFTDYFRTSYIISGSKNFEEGLNLLIDYVQTPYFMEKDVNKEKGIIIQEYKTYMDEPDEILALRIKRNIYDKAYTKDILGNIKDIKSINSDILNTAYDIFYHPSNMNLIITGDLDPYKVIELVENNQNNKKYQLREKPIHITYEENKKIIKSKKIKIDAKMDIVKMAVRIDKNEFDENELLFFETKMNIILELLCGPMSKNYQEMLDKDLITSFSYSIRIDDKYHPYLYFSTKSNNALEFVKYFKKLIKNIDKLQINEEDFSLMKKGLIGQSMMATNVIDDTVITLTEYLIKNADLFSCVSNYNNLTIEEVKEMVKYINYDNLSYVIGKGSSE